MCRRALDALCAFPGACTRSASPLSALGLRQAWPFCESCVCCQVDDGPGGGPDGADAGARWALERELARQLLPVRHARAQRGRLRAWHTLVHLMSGVKAPNRQRVLRRKDPGRLRCAGVCGGRRRPPALFSVTCVPRCRDRAGGAARRLAAHAAPDCALRRTDAAPRRARQAVADGSVLVRAEAAVALARLAAAHAPAVAEAVLAVQRRAARGVRGAALAPGAAAGLTHSAPTQTAAGLARAAPASAAPLPAASGAHFGICAWCMVGAWPAQQGCGQHRKVASVVPQPMAGPRCGCAASRPCPAHVLKCLEEPEPASTWWSGGADSR